MTDKDYWAMFAAACMAGEGNADNAAHFADRLLVEMKKRFPDPKRHEDHFMWKPVSELNDEERLAMEKYKRDFPSWRANLRDI